MERRNSDHDEPAQPPTSPNVFGDDYEIDPDEDDFMPSVSDGFRPANTTTTTTTTTSEDANRQRHAHAHAHAHAHDRHRDETPQRHTSTSKPHEPSLRRKATRNSTAKTRDSMAHDSAGRPPSMLHHHRPVSPSPLAHRASVSSTGSFATTSNGDNPFETGPSHPYGMYPQNTMARTSSVATASTARQSQRPMSLQRPTHPYAMYSQSGLDDGPPDESAHPPVPPPSQSAIPVGFPGLNNGYHRVLGPDGEEQDIIGPDGHTEQLPPYSRYPEEGPTKASMAAEASASRILPAPSSLIDTDDPFTTPASPVSPLSATSFSAPALPSVPPLPSVTPARLPPQRPETQTGGVASATSASAATAAAAAASQIPAEPSDSSSASLLTTEQGFSEKEESADPNPKWYQRKLWGKIPWPIAAVIVFSILAGTIGAVLGTLAARKDTDPEDDEHGGPKDEPLPQVTGSHGSLFGATPIPTPPGLSSLPTGAFSLPLGIPQESNPGCLTQANQYAAWSCKLGFAPLVITINDTSANEDAGQVASMRTGSSVPDGSILYGLQTPDLSQQHLQLVLDLDYKAYGPAYHFTSRYDKLVILRAEELSGGSGIQKRQDTKSLRQHFLVKPGDLPWYCFWNQTYIEGYVYTEDNSTAALFTAFPTPTGSSTASFDTSSLLAALATLPPSTASAPTLTISPGAAATSAPISRRDAQADSMAPPRMPPYPRIVKIEERRLPDSPQPYCQQMVLLDNGRITPAPNGNDGPKKVWLQAVDPSYEEYFAAEATPLGKRKRDTSLARRGDPSNACHCQWMFR